MGLGLVVGTIFAVVAVLSASSLGSCSSSPKVYPGEMVALPSNLSSTPAMMRSSVLFPDPFSPSTPILAP